MIHAELTYHGIKDGRAWFSTRFEFDRQMCFDKLHQGDHVRARITQPRSVADHRTFFGVIGKAWANQRCFPPFDTPERLRKHLLIRAGHCDVWEIEPEILIDAKFLRVLQRISDDLEFEQIGHRIRVKRAKSIEFSQCDQAEFSPVREAVYDIITTEIVPGSTIEGFIDAIKSEAA